MFYVQLRFVTLVVGINLTWLNVLHQISLKCLSVYPAFEFRFLCFGAHLWSWTSTSAHAEENNPTRLSNSNVGWCARARILNH